MNVLIERFELARAIYLAFSNLAIYDLKKISPWCFFVAPGA